MRNKHTHFAYRVLAFVLTLCLVFQLCPPAVVQAAAFDNWDDEIITGLEGEASNDTGDVFGGVADLSPVEQAAILNEGEEPAPVADTVYYVSFEDYTGSAFTSKVVKLENTPNARAVELIGRAVGTWDGVSVTPDIGYDFAGLDYPNVVINTKLDPNDEWSDSYVTGLVIDGKTVSNAGSNKWIVTVQNEYGAAEYCKFSRANADYNTMPSGSVVRVMYTTDNGGNVGACIFS